MDFSNKGYLDYVDLKYKPSKEDVICLFKFKTHKKGFERMAAGAIAAESSTGTWTTLTTMGAEKMAHLGAKVFELERGYAKIAYPNDLFEKGNMPQILSSVAGNIFGMKEIKSLRLEDIRLNEALVKSFKGPQFGVKGIRKMLGVKKRALCGTIIKPKLGLSWKEHANVAYEAWVGGLDIVKDDENLTSQSFNNFEKRMYETLKMKEKAEKETGEKKLYLANVTAETQVMNKRADLVEKLGNNSVMVDILTCGWSSFQSLREHVTGKPLALHGHRAMHAAFTRNSEHGINMRVLVVLSRLIGIDLLHIGTGVGKMEGTRDEIKDYAEHCQLERIKESREVLKKDFYNRKGIFAVCSGGLYPGAVPILIKSYGNDIVVQAGGGVHGNPYGTRGGAKAMRDAVECASNNIPIKEYAKKSKELKAAIEEWGTVDV